jgi:hypothetical protein
VYMIIAPSASAILMCKFVQNHTTRVLYHCG